MKTAAFLVAAALAASSPALAGAGDFGLVNGTGAAISEVAISPYGKNAWRPLPVAPSPGARGTVRFADEDCAFDIRASVAGASTVTWSGINLCDAKSVTLNRNEAGALWVDYD